MIMGAACPGEPARMTLFVVFVRHRLPSLHWLMVAAARADCRFIRALETLELL
jgi:hypothetical protein